MCCNRHPIWHNEKSTAPCQIRYFLIHADKLLFISFLCEQPLTAESLNQSRQVGCEEILKGEAACANHEGVRGVKLLFETR